MSESKSSAQLALSVTEAARRLGLSRNFAYQLAANGGLPTIRLGNRILVPVIALEKMLEIAPKALAEDGAGGAAEVPEQAA